MFKAVRAGWIKVCIDSRVAVVGGESAIDSDYNIE